MEESDFIRLTLLATEFEIHALSVISNASTQRENPSSTNTPLLTRSRFSKEL